MTLTRDVLCNTILNRDFFRNVYLFFAENDEVEQVYTSKFIVSNKMGFSKGISVGCSAFAQIMNDKNLQSLSWGFSKGKLKVIWAPRWSTDIKIGGSNFFTYKDVILDYAKNNPDVDFLLRPHPLMFSHFEETGELPEGSRKEYIAKVDLLQNVEFDKQKTYDATFWNSDVLITDISGILPEYFITGKPIIFCSTNFILQPLEITKKILSGCYVAKSKNELIGYIDQLKNGQDPLMKKRHELVSRLLDKSIDANTVIINELLR